MADLVTRLETLAMPAEDATGRWPDLRRLVVRTLADTVEDRVPGMAAEMAFFAVLSLPPLLLVVVGAVGFVVGGLPEADLVAIEGALLDALSALLSQDTVEQVLADPVGRLLREGRSDLLSLGLVLTLWSASRSTNVLLRVLIIAYDLADHRKPWQRRLLAVGLTVAGVLVAVVVLPLVVIGPDVAAETLSLLGVSGTGLARFWPLTYWIGVGGVGLAALTWIYHVAPGWYTPWRRDLPGAVLAMLGLVAASAGIRVYTSGFATFSSNDTFRGLAAPLVLMLWVWASGIAVLVGAELNAEIERLWPSDEGPYEERMPRERTLATGDVLLHHIAEQTGQPPSSHGDSGAASDTPDGDGG